MLQRKRVVCIGGRPGSNRAIRRIVQTAACGELTLHDGGLEDRKGLLAAALPGANMVVFPVECIDHDSVNLLKRLCERHQIEYYPLRTASVASFVELIGRLDAHVRQVMPPDGQTGEAPRFCLRHGQATRRQHPTAHASAAHHLRQRGDLARTGRVSARLDLAITPDDLLADRRQHAAAAAPAAVFGNRRGRASILDGSRGTLLRPRARARRYPPAASCHAARATHPRRRTAAALPSVIDSGRVFNKRQIINRIPVYFLPQARAAPASNLNPMMTTDLRRGSRRYPA